MNKLPKRSAYYIVLWQIMLVLLAAFFYSLLDSWSSGGAVILGGFASFLPSFLFAWRLFQTTAARDAQKIVSILFAGGILKLFLSGALLVIMIMLLPLKALPLIVGFASAHLGFWVGPLTKRMNI